MTDLIVFFLLLIGFPVALILMTFAARDMDRRGLDGRLYGLLLFILPIGLAVWMYQRLTHPVLPPEQLAEIEAARFGGQRPT